MSRLSSKPCGRAEAFFFALAVAGFGAGCGPQVRNTPGAKLDSNLFREARRADALGLTPTATLSTLPVKEGDLARAVGDGGPECAPPGAGPPLTPDESWFAGVKELHRLTIEDALDDSGFQASFFEPVEDARLRYLFVDGPIKFYNEGGRTIGEGS